MTNFSTAFANWGKTLVENCTCMLRTYIEVLAQDNTSIGFIQPNFFNTNKMSLSDDLVCSANICIKKEHYWVYPNKTRSEHKVGCLFRLKRQMLLDETVFDL